MKIGMIVPGGVGRNGVDKVIPCLLWLIERLAHKVELHVFALRQEPMPATYQLFGATVHNIGARPRRARALAAILSENRRARFDVLHAFWAAPQGVVAGVIGGLTNIPILLHLPGGDLAAIPDIGYGASLAWRGRTWLRYATASATRCIVPSAAMQTSAVARGYQADVLPWGVALDRWPPVPPRQRNIPSRAQLLHVATLNKVKDQGTLLRAIRMLSDGGMDFHFDIVGEDTLNGAVQRLAHELGIADRVTFHGLLPHSALRVCFERADMLVMSSRHEAGPVVMLEAAVAGVPTVGTAVGQIADWHGAASMAVPVADVRALARAIGELLEDEPRRLRLARSAQERAIARDADWNASRVLDLYFNLIDGPRGLQ